jgi:hypothetical protein
MQQERIHQILVKDNYRLPDVGGAIAKRVERDGSVRFGKLAGAHGNWKGGTCELDAVAPG